MKGAASTAPLLSCGGPSQIAVGLPFESPLSHRHASTTHLPSTLGIVLGVRFAHSKSTSLGQGRRNVLHAASVGCFSNSARCSLDWSLPGRRQSAVICDTWRGMPTGGAYLGGGSLI